MREPNASPWPITRPLKTLLPPSQSILFLEFRPMKRFSLLSAALVLLGASSLRAQTDPSPARMILAPQVGGVVSHSAGTDEAAFASLTAEVPVSRMLSVAVEGTAMLGDVALRACPFHPGEPCRTGTELRSAAAAGVVARPVRLGPLVPYAGIAAGVARWARDEDRGTAPLAAVRAGLDLRIIGPFGVRADLVRRIAWADDPEASPLHMDVFSLGVSFALRR